MADRDSDYLGLLSAVEDVARRIGPAANPEWIREQLAEITSRHRRWIEARAAAARPLPTYPDDCW